MFFITSDKCRVIDIRDHINPKLPIWTKDHHQFAVEIASTEYLNTDEKTSPMLPAGWVVLK